MLERPGKIGAAPFGAQGATPYIHPRGMDALLALCMVARSLYFSADSSALLNQLGKSASATIEQDDLLLCSKHLGLKAKVTTTGIDRLPLVPLPEERDKEDFAQQLPMLDHAGDEPTEVELGHGACE